MDGREGVAVSANEIGPMTGRQTTVEPDAWAKIKEIFNAALDVPTSERDAFIGRECDGDTEIASEVLSLLDAHVGASEFIEKPASSSVTDFVERSRTSRVGQILGSYRIEGEIGKGGMGAVFLASRADSEFKKKVAVKLIKRGFDTDEIIRRFRHERQILATLEHPYIARLIDGGATDDGLPYLVMDYVRGRTLTRFADENELAIGERLELFMKVCSAVSYAHQNLVVHRDLKPSNILVLDDGSPRLLDFGIAKLIAADEATLNADPTNTLARAMTPEYASPEQVSGHPVSTSSDIYSLGVILYELLTGYRPFQVKTNRADEIVRIITDTSPTKPSSICRSQGVRVSVRNPQYLAKELRGDLDNIILMAIRKEPERRYSSVEQFAEDIRRFLAGLPVIAQEDTFSYRASKFVKRNKAGVAAGIGVGVSLIAGIIASSRQAKIAARQRDRARREARKAEKVNEFLQRMLASADPRVVGKDVKVIEVLEIAARSLESDFANQPDIAARLELTLGRTYLSLGQLESAEKHLRFALRLCREAFPKRSVQMARTVGAIGRLLQQKGDIKNAEPAFEEALATLRSIHPGTLDEADLLNEFGYLVALKGDLDRALKLHRDELDIKRRSTGEDSVEVAKSLEKIGGVLISMGRNGDGEPMLRRSLQIFQKVHGPEHPDIALSMINLAGAIIETRPAEAEALCRESLSMRRKLLGEDHVDVVWSLYNLAYVLINCGDPEGSRRFMLEALGKRGVNLPDDNPVVSSCLLLLGRCQIETGDPRGALEIFRECLALRTKTLPKDHWLLSSTRSFIGECLFKLGETEAGAHHIRESYAAIRAKLGNDHVQVRQLAERMRKLGVTF